MIVNSKKWRLVFSELQTPSPAEDLTFVCEDGIVRSHQALFSWMSSFLRRMMEDSGKRKDEVTLFLPSVECKTLNQIIKILTNGEVVLQKEKNKRDISDLWEVLNVDRIDYISLKMTQLGPDVSDNEACVGQKGEPEVIDLVNDDNEDDEDVADADADVSPPLVKAETVDQPSENVDEDNRETIRNTSEGEAQENTRKSESKNMIEKYKEVESTMEEVPKTKRRGRKPKSDVKSVQENPIDLKNRMTKSNNAPICVLPTSPEETDNINRPPITISKDMKSARKDNVCGFKQLVQSLPDINISKASDQTQDKQADKVSFSSQDRKKSISVRTHHPHISITKQVRVLHDTPALLTLKEPQIKKTTEVKELEHEVPESLELLLPDINPEETNEETRNEDEVEEAGLDDNHENSSQLEKIISQDERSQTHEDNVQANSVHGKPTIVVEGFDEFHLEIKHEVENNEQSAFNADHGDEIEDENIDDFPIFNSLKKRKISEDLVTENSLKRRRSTRLKATERSESKAKEFENSKRQEVRSTESRMRAGYGRRVYEENHNCLVCGQGLNIDRDILRLKEHYSRCLYDNDNVYPSLLSPGRGNTAPDGSPLDDQALKYRCAVKGCLHNMKNNSKGMFSYRNYAIHMSKDHGILEKVFQSDPREGMEEILETLKKSGHFNPGIIKCRFSDCEQIFNRESKRDQKVHYATSHLKKHFPVREETGLSPGFCKEDTKCRCVRCEENGKKILIMAGLDDTIRHLVITHDGLKTILEDNMTEPQVSVIFNDIYGESK